MAAQLLLLLLVVYIKSKLNETRREEGVLAGWLL